MPVTKAVDLIDRAGRLIQDTGFVRWTRQELLDYLNDAQKEVVVHRPDAKTVNESMATVLGTKQTLPAAAIRLIDVTRNVDGRVITQVSRRILDEQLPDWHNQPALGADAAEHFAYDERDPKTFFLYPKVKAGISVEIVYSTVPAAITSAQADLSDIASATIGIDDVYANAILDYILYRAYSKDTEYAGNLQRAGMHLQGFGNTLGVKMKMDAAMAPTPSNPDANQGRS